MASIFSRMSTFNVTSSIQVPSVRRRATDVYWPPKKSSSIFDTESWSILHDAAYTNNIDLIEKEIKENKIDVDIQDYYGQTPLWWASNNNSYNAANLLTLFGANVNKSDNQGKTPIQVAKSIDMIQLLLVCGAKIKSTDVLGNSLLHELAHDYNVENKYEAQKNATLIKHIIDKKFVSNEQINAKNKFGKTPYDVACGGTFSNTKRAFEEAKIDELYKL